MMNTLVVVCILSSLNGVMMMAQTACPRIESTFEISGDRHMNIFVKTSQLEEMRALTTAWKLTLKELGEVPKTIVQPTVISASLCMLSAGETACTKFEEFTQQQRDEIAEAQSEGRIVFVKGTDCSFLRCFMYGAYKCDVAFMPKVETLLLYEIRHKECMLCEGDLCIPSTSVRVPSARINVVPICEDVEAQHVCEDNSGHKTMCSVSKKDVVMMKDLSSVVSTRWRGCAPPMDVTLPSQTVTTQAALAVSGDIAKLPKLQVKAIGTTELCSGIGFFMGDKLAHDCHCIEVGVVNDLIEVRCNTSESLNTIRAVRVGCIAFVETLNRRVSVHVTSSDFLAKVRTDGFEVVEKDVYVKSATNFLHPKLPQKLINPVDGLELPPSSIKSDNDSEILASATSEVREGVGKNDVFRRL